MSTTAVASERGIPVPALRRLARRTTRNSALTVFLLLQELADDDGRVTITRTRIIEHTALSLTGVTNTVALLVEAGLVEIEHYPGPLRGYRLRLLPIRERDERPIASVRA